MSILDEMKVRRLYCDGGMGSLLQERGLLPGELPETWNVLPVNCQSAGIFPIRKLLQMCTENTWQQVRIL